jgi:GT2 family glycosyltransferase
MERFRSICQCIQHLLIPHPEPPGKRPLEEERRPTVLASVIVPVFNQLGFTRPCVSALGRHTRRSWELVVVDNGSNDGTAAYLAGLRDAAPFSLTVISNTTNRGFPAACNQGLAAARGEYLVLLNNDAVVTDAWLDQLIALADSAPDIGMAGPVSNYASPPQLVPDVPYADLGAMDRFASEWRRQNRGRWLEASKLSGFCLLMKRRALEAVGGLDEQFGLGLFDDEDLSLRMRQAGFRLALALDLFVHHFGSRTFVGAGIDTASLFRENRDRFEAKWGVGASVGQEVAVAPWSGSPEQAGIAKDRKAPPPVSVAPSIIDRLPQDFVVPRLKLGNSKEMVEEALAIVAGLPGTATHKAALWERLADQIIEHGRRNGSTWGMERLRGVDGSIVYMGRAAEFLVFDTSGRLFRGQGPGCLAGSQGGSLIPHYPAMKAMV